MPSSPASHPLQVNQIDPNNEKAMTRFLDGIASAFRDTTVSRAFISEIDNTPPPYPSPSFNVSRIRQHITPGITDAAHSGAVLFEAGNFSALAVWEPPTFRGKPFSEVNTTSDRPIRTESAANIRALKEKYIGTVTKDDGTVEVKPFYHLGFLVRNPDVESVPGAISAVIRPVLEQAEQEGVPAWLEATYRHAVDVYKYLGFREVETMVVGRGKRSAEGWPEEGGPGVNLYAMIYDAHLQSSDV